MIGLLILLIGLMIVACARSALRPAGVELNHVVLFSFGLAFYWILPVVVGLVRVLAEQPALALWYATWDAAARSGAMTSFLALALVTYAAFLAGDWVGSRLRVADPAGTPTLPWDPRLLRLLMLPVLAITAAYAWHLRAQLFAGYRYEAISGVNVRGTLNACSLVLLALCLLRAAEVERWPRLLRGWRGLAIDPFLIAFSASAVLLLSLGGRLYVVSAVLMAVVYLSVYHRPLSSGRAVVIPIVIASLAGVAGSLRFGYAPSPLQVVINVLAEPLFTSFSLLDFMAQGKAPWLAAPRFLLSDFLNLVPTALLPTKTEMLLDPADFGYSIFSPFGALNSYVSWMINFGRIGTPFAMFVLGGGLALLKRRRTPLARVIYVMLSGWLPFTFFRDAFSISIVKNMFEFSILVPTLSVWAAHVITVIAPRHEPPVHAAAARSPS